jgi:hypothetical protein
MLIGMLKDSAPPNTACSRPAKLRQLIVNFDGWRLGGSQAADAGTVRRMNTSGGLDEERGMHDQYV